VLNNFGLENRDGELVLLVPDERFGDALYSFSQALIKISDVSFLSREVVRSAFLDDFKHRMMEWIPAERRAFAWHYAEKDPDAHYPVDCRLNNRKVPLFIFALQSEAKVQYATIALHQYEKWGLQFESMGIFEDLTKISQSVVARFMDVSGKDYSSLYGNQDRIKQQLERELAKA
jgi:hypothetical protein